jgi:sarcosine oxidase subunit gamma
VSDPALNPQPAYHGHLAFTGMGEPADQAGVMIEPRDDLAMAIVMPRKGQGAALAALVRQTCGVDLPAGPKRIAAGPLAFVGMGPGQCLAVEQGGDALTFASRLGKAFGAAASISDQSDSRAVLRLSGPRARNVLAKGLAIDLHPRVFGPGDAALSSIALIGAHLWQLDDAPTYEISVFRSMAGSFADFLWSSAAEYGVFLKS